MRTSFWNDRWLPCGPLRTVFPALFSHATCSEITVREARREGVHALLALRLTPLAACECADVQQLVDSCRGSESLDSRLAPLCSGTPGRFSARAVYALHRLGGVGAETATFLWSNRGPSCLKFFGWLLSLSRIHTRDVLLRKSILTTEQAGCMWCEAVLETVNHLIFGCPLAVQFWRCLDVSPEDASVGAVHLFNVAGAVGDTSSLWKRRNNVVFRDDTPSLAATLKACRDDAMLWRASMKTAGCLAQRA
ncbi:hypothetical protein ZWY2020_038888 [Hordeum vulgare]|nr:hypothetical protein ZWY2020_038888 [Hordeum vulgare]